MVRGIQRIIIIVIIMIGYIYAKVLILNTTENESAPFLLPVGAVQ